MFTIGSECFIVDVIKYETNLGAVACNTSDLLDHIVYWVAQHPLSFFIGIHLQ